jgi:hypothetical protein
MRGIVLYRGRYLYGYSIEKRTFGRMRACGDKKPTLVRLSDNKGYEALRGDVGVYALPNPPTPGVSSAFDRSNGGAQRQTQKILPYYRSG